jgi:hypothetical protein
MSHRWRLSIPEKWREASVLNQDGIMDPNLTLAHITQNTAVIQLHQCVAFPPAALRACRVALPSTSSAETCISAAYKIGTIAQQFLQQSSGITHPSLDPVYSSPAVYSWPTLCTMAPQSILYSPPFLQPCKKSARARTTTETNNLSLIYITNDASETPERVHKIVMQYNHNTPRLVPPSIPLTWHQASLIDDIRASSIKMTACLKGNPHQ